MFWLLSGKTLKCPVNNIPVAGGLICIDKSNGGTKELSRPQGQPARDLAVNAARALYDGKGSDVIVLDVRDVTLIADYFVIASGSNPRHVRALADRLLKTSDEIRKPMHVEGYQIGYWVLLDYGDVVVHVFREDERNFYGLERLWGDAPEVEFEERSTSPAP